MNEIKYILCTSIYVNADLDALICHRWNYYVYRLKHKQRLTETTKSLGETNSSIKGPTENSLFLITQ